MSSYEDTTEMGDNFNVSAERSVQASDTLELSGGPRMICETPDGEVRWESEVPNLVTDEGENHALHVVLAGGTQITTWAVGLLDSAPGTPAETWTLGNITGTGTPTQEFQGFSEANRQAYNLPTGTPTGQSVDNTGSPASFSITSTGTVGGAFVASTNTLGATAGILYNVATDSRTVQSGDTVKVEYTNNAGGA